MLFGNRWHNFTPGIARDYRLPLFETACRNAFQGRWPRLCWVILTCLPPPQLSSTDDFWLYGRSISQTISRLLVLTVIKKLPAKHILHIVLQCPSFTVTCLFPVFPYIESDWFSSLPEFDWFSSLLFMEWSDSSIPNNFVSLAAFIHSTVIITLVSRMMKFALPSQKGLPTHSNDSMVSFIPEICLGSWIPSMIFVRARLGCQMFALKFIQRANYMYFRPCEHPVPSGIMFLSNLLSLHHSIQQFMHLGMAKGREHICRFVNKCADGHITDIYMRSLIC